MQSISYQQIIKSIHDKIDEIAYSESAATPSQIVDLMHGLGLPTKTTSMIRSLKKAYKPVNLDDKKVYKPKNNLDEKQFLIRARAMARTELRQIEADKKAITAPKSPKAKSPKEIKGKVKNAWIEHVKQYKLDHPGISHKRAMTEAKDTYKPVAKVKKARVK